MQRRKEQVLKNKNGINGDSCSLNVKRCRAAKSSMEDSKKKMKCNRNYNRTMSTLDNGVFW